MTHLIKKSILASFVADTYCLGSHWVYDAEELKNLNINWEKLNPPYVEWHAGKEKGDFTHYGDQSLFLLEYLNEYSSFNKMSYYTYWTNKMKNYKGYVDGSMKNALEKIDSASNDLSICGRIAPLLLSSNTKDEFLTQVKQFSEISHNTELANDVSQFFAELLWDTKENNNLAENIQSLKTNYPALTQWIDTATLTKNDNTMEILQSFGVTCNIDGGFAGVIHLLSLEDDFQTIMIKNAKAGGDSSSRAMVVAMILGVNETINLPEEWVNNMSEIKNIKKLLSL